MSFQIVYSNAENGSIQDFMDCLKSAQLTQMELWLVYKGKCFYIDPADQLEDLLKKYRFEPTFEQGKSQRSSMRLEEVLSMAGITHEKLATNDINRSENKNSATIFGVNDGE